MALKSGHISVYLLGSSRKVAGGEWQDPEQLKNAHHGSQCIETDCHQSRSGRSSHRQRPRARAAGASVQN